MLTRYLPLPALTVWLVGLLLVGLTLTACGAATPVSDETSASAETEATADTSTAVETEPTQEEEVAAEEETSPDEEVAATEESTSAEPTEETAAQENLSESGASAQATCEPIVIPDNNLIAAVSDSDWTQGPADAPVTVIEYGDFQ